MLKIFKMFTNKKNNTQEVKGDVVSAQITENAIADCTLKPVKKYQSILFATKVLGYFRENVGRYHPESGGLLGSTKDPNRIDLCCFDEHSRNTSGTFYYDVESMSAVFRVWKSRGYITNGIFHSHPIGAIRPSFHDISTALLHLDFLNIDYFYLPIIQPNNNGQYQMYFYVIRRKGQQLETNLEYVLKATASGYEYVPHTKYCTTHSIEELRAYRNTLGGPKEAKKEPIKEKRAVETKPDYFSKVRSLYPDNVLDKVLVCIGTGGARSFLEDMARSGFRNYVLIDADVVSPTNIATQAVYISEMGKKKVEVIRDKILDINPEAKVVCVDRFLDDKMSDEDFIGYLKSFSGKKAKDYLILGCTDNFNAQKRSSLLALKYGMPYLAAMMYEGGAAAEVIFVYPGVTASCPRCLLRDRFEKYESGFINDVDSSACPIFATERMNSLKGYIALMMLMYHESPQSPFNNMLYEVKDRNFVEIRMTPYLKDSKLGIGLFDRVLDGASRYTYMDETLWIPQHPDSSEYGEKACKLCGGTGDLRHLQEKWRYTDTRYITFVDVEKPDTTSMVLPNASGFYASNDLQQDQTKTVTDT